MLLDRLLYSDRAPSILIKAMDFQSQRHLLISSNISNMDTPGYKAKDIDFEGQLRETIGTQNDLNVVGTHKKHLAPGTDEIQAIAPDVYEEPDAAKSNGNNVNIDKEMMKLAENQVNYNAAIQLLAKRASTLRAAITESAQ